MATTRANVPLRLQLYRQLRAAIEGGSLAKMGGLIREASDMQRIAREGAAKPKGDK